MASFAVGHMALAYLLGKVSSKPLHLKPNIPLILVLSIVPDADLILQWFTQVDIHRGPTHSIITAVLIFAPVFILYGKRAVPYFLAFISHALIGDFFIGGQIQLFWPLSTQPIGLHELGYYYISIFSKINVFLELTLFTLAIAVMVKTKDFQVFFTKSKMNLVLIIPVFTVLLPTTIGYPFSSPLFFTVPLLALAHLFYLILFSLSISTVLLSLLRIKNSQKL